VNKIDHDDLITHQNPTSYQEFKKDARKCVWWFITAYLLCVGVVGLLMWVKP
jgi:hypothetical protein